MFEAITAPVGFRFAAVYAGIRKTDAPDLALIVSDRPAAAAGVFTTNRVVAAPVVLSREHLQAGGDSVRAIVVNAGNANCAAANGMAIARGAAKAMAQRLGTDPEHILVASTGVIGVPMNPDSIPAALPEAFARLAPEGYEDAARAIMTTDTRPKLAFRAVAGSRRGSEIRVLGMAKGAGMIHPRMATMLAFIVTDAAVPAASLQAMTAKAAGGTFNRISVDGDMSTNDTLFVLANGASGAVSAQRFAAALEEVMGELAVAIVADGEGAQKLIRIEIAGGRDDAQADQVGRAIANSPLFKTAMTGGDPNWGRILSAAGASGVAIDPARVDIVLNGTLVCRKGLAADFDDAALGQALAAAREITVQVKLGTGRGSATLWTCDLTEEYIRINATYRT